MVCFWYIVVNTLHKDDDKDNNILQDLRIKPGPIHKLKTITEPSTETDLTADITLKSRKPMFNLLAPEFGI
jgi:hypothetical protein